MNNQFYQKLVDMYAENELSAELTQELEQVAKGDKPLQLDMSSLKQTVEALREEAAPIFTEESNQRILMKLYARGAAVESRNTTPFHLQYPLPISG
jgi:anti-sigma factor RsiW